MTKLNYQFRPVFQGAKTTVYFAFKNNYVFILEKDEMIATAKKVVQSNPDCKDKTIEELAEVFKNGMVYLTRWDRFKIIFKNLSSIYKILLRILVLRIIIFFRDLFKGKKKHQE